MRRLFILLAAFTGLGLAYSVATPIFETPDELQHFAVVNYIAHYWWFPPLGAPGQHYWDQQALQAPLFYWTAAALTAWVDTSDLSRQAILQPKADIGDATLPGKKNAFLHRSDQDFPYQGTTLAVHLCRWLALLFGVGTVTLTYGLARLLFVEIGRPQWAAGSSDWLALLPAGALAFIPQFLFIQTSCSNDAAVTLTSTLTLFVLIKSGRSQPTARQAILFGLCLALMALSKLAGTVLAVVGLILFGFSRRRLIPVLWAAAAFAGVAGWWYVRNQLVYGDPLALQAFLAFVGGNLTVPPLSAEIVWGQFRLLRFSTWGLFGQISVLMQPEWLYLVFDAAAAIGLGSALWAGGRWCLKQRYWSLAVIDHHRAAISLAVWLAAVLAIGVRWFLAAGMQGRLIFPGLAAAAVVLGGGVRRVLPPTWSPAALTLGVVIPLAAFAAFAVPAYLLPAYSAPPLIARVPDGVTTADIQFADEIALRGYTIARNGAAGRLIHLTFFWEALRTPAADYTVAIRLVRPDGSLWLDYVNYPGMGTTFPAAWLPGQLRQDEYVFDRRRLPAGAGPLRLIVGFYDSRVAAMVPISRGSDSREPGWAALAEIGLTDP